MADTTYATPEQAVGTLRPGWKIVGRVPKQVEVPNPARIPDATGKVPDITAPATIKQTIGEELSIEGPNGEPDKMTVSTGFPTSGGGMSVSVLEGPAKGPSATKTPTASAALDKLDANGKLLDPGSTVRPSFVRDPSTGVTFQTDQTVPTDPSTWTKITDPNEPDKVIALFDPANSKIAATVPQGSTTPKRKGEYTDLIDPNDPKGKRVIGKIDTGSKEIFAVSRDTASQKQIVSTPEKIFVFNDDGTLNDTFAVDKKQPLQAVIIDNTAYTFDPAATDPSKAFTKVEGINPATTLSTVTTAKNLEWYDQQGNLVKSVPNSNYAPQQPAQGQQSTTAPYIQQWNQKTSEWEWVENKGRVTASTALQNMASVLSGQVVDGTISLDEAKELIAASNTTMTNAISAASNVLDYTAKGAQTGAGLLQQRASTAQGMLGQVLGMAGERSPSGKYGGGMLSVPAGIGPEITGGIQQYTAGLMGGQGTLDAAARMVQAASGGDGGSPAAATAIGALTQMMDKYRALSGSDHPIVQAHNAAQESQKQNGLTAPQPSPGFGGGPYVGAANPNVFGGGMGTFQAPPAAQPNPFAQSGIAEGSSRGFTAPSAAPTVVLNVSS